MSKEVKKILPLVLIAGTAVAAGLSHGDALSLVQAKPGQNKGAERYLPQGAPSQVAFRELVKYRALSLDVRNNLVAAVVQDLADPALQSYVTVGKMQQGQLQLRQAGLLPDGSYPLMVKWLDTTPLSLAVSGRNLAEPNIYRPDRGRFWTSKDILNWEEIKSGFDVQEMQLGSSSFAIARETDPLNRAADFYKRVDLQSKKVTALSYCPCPPLMLDTQLRKLADGSDRGFGRLTDLSGYAVYKVLNGNMTLISSITGRGILAKGLVSRVEGDNEVIFSAGNRLYLDRFDRQGNLINSRSVEPNQGLYGGQEAHLIASWLDKYLFTNTINRDPKTNLFYITGFIEQVNPSRHLTDQGDYFKQRGQDVILTYPVNMIESENTLIISQLLQRYSGVWLYPEAGWITTLDIAGGNKWKSADVQIISELAVPVATPTPVLTQRLTLPFTPGKAR